MPEYKVGNSFIQERYGTESAGGSFGFGGGFGSGNFGFGGRDEEQPLYLPGETTEEYQERIRKEREDAKNPASLTGSILGGLGALIGKAVSLPFRAVKSGVERTGQLLFDEDTTAGQVFDSIIEDVGNAGEDVVEFLHQDVFQGIARNVVSASKTVGQGAFDILGVDYEDTNYDPNKNLFGIEGTAGLNRFLFGKEEILEYDEQFKEYQEAFKKFGGGSLETDIWAGGFVALNLLDFTALGGFGRVSKAGLKTAYEITENVAKTTTEQGVKDVLTKTPYSQILGTKEINKLSPLLATEKNADKVRDILDNEIIQILDTESKAQIHKRVLYNHTGQYSQVNDGLGVVPLDADIPFNQRNIASLLVRYGGAENFIKKADEIVEKGYISQETIQYIQKTKRGSDINNTDVLVYALAEDIATNDKTVRDLTAKLTKLRQDRTNSYQSIKDGYQKNVQGLRDERVKIGNDLVKNLQDNGEFLYRDVFKNIQDDPLKEIGRAGILRDGAEDAIGKGLRALRNRAGKDVAQDRIPQPRRIIKKDNLNEESLKGVIVPITTAGGYQVNVDASLLLKNILKKDLDFLKTQSKKDTIDVPRVLQKMYDDSDFGRRLARDETQAFESGVLKEDLTRMINNGQLDSSTIKGMRTTQILKQYANSLEQYSKPIDIDGKTFPINLFVNPQGKGRLKGGNDRLWINFIKKYNEEIEARARFGGVGQLATNNKNIDNLTRDIKQLKEELKVKRNRVTAGVMKDFNRNKGANTEQKLDSLYQKAITARQDYIEKFRNREFNVMYGRRSALRKASDKITAIPVIGRKIEEGGLKVAESIQNNKIRAIAPIRKYMNDVTEGRFEKDIIDATNPLQEDILRPGALQYDINTFNDQVERFIQKPITQIRDKVNLKNKGSFTSVNINDDIGTLMVLRGFTERARHLKLKDTESLGKRTINGKKVDITIENYQALEQQLKEKYGDDVMKDINKVIEQTEDIYSKNLDILFDAGRFTETRYNQLKGIPDFVRLERELAKDHLDLQARWGGYVDLQPFRSAKGSERAIVNPIETAVQQRQDALVFHARQKVNKSFGDYFDANPELMRRMGVQKIGTDGTVDLGDDGVKQILSKRTVDGIPEDVVQELYKGNIFQYADKGETVRYYIKDTATAAAFNSSSVTNAIPLIVNATGFISRAVTQWDASFGPPNAIRDYGSLMLNAQQYLNFVDTTKIAVRAPVTTAQLFRYHLRKKKFGADGKEIFDNKTFQRIDEFYRDGGTTGGFARHAREEEVINRDYVDMIKSSDDLKSRSLLKTGKLFSHWNSGWEDSARFNIYDTLRNKGYNGKNAAEISKTVTINFNEKGNWSPLLNSVYMFLNAGVQGSTRTARAIIDNPQLLLRVFSGHMATTNAIDDWNTAVDPDWKRKLGKHSQKRYYSILLPDDDAENGFQVFQIPIDHGQIPIKNAVDTLNSYTRGEIDQLQFTKNMIGGFINEWTPMGAGDVRDLISPTVFDPINQAMQNRNWAGTTLSNIETSITAKDAEFEWEKDKGGLRHISRWLSKQSDTFFGKGISAAQIENIFLGYGGGNYFKTLSKGAEKIEGKKDIDDRIIGESRFFGFYPKDMEQTKNAISSKIRDRIVDEYRRTPEGTIERLEVIRKYTDRGVFDTQQDINKFISQIRREGVTTNTQNQAKEEAGLREIGISFSQNPQKPRIELTNEGEIVTPLYEEWYNYARNRGYAVRDAKIYAEFMQRYSTQLVEQYEGRRYNIDNTRQRDRFEQNINRNIQNRGTLPRAV